MTSFSNTIKNQNFIHALNLDESKIDLKENEDIKDNDQDSPKKYHQDQNESMEVESHRINNPGSNRINPSSKIMI